MKKFCGLLAAAVCLSGAAAAHADYSDNFNNPVTALSGWTLTNSAGISATHTYSSPLSLYVPAASTALVNIPGLSAGGVLTVKVFDQGNYTDKLQEAGTGVNGVPAVYDGVTYDNGWRVGVTPSPDGNTGTVSTAMILVDQRTYVSGNYYSFSVGDSTPFGGFYSPGYTGDLRTDLSATPNNGSFAADGGQWTSWQYDISSAGVVTYFELDGTGAQMGPTLTSTLGAAADSFFVYGGDSTSLNAGVYVDDINFVSAPEPASLSLLALAGGGMLLRRRRRHA